MPLLRAIDLRPHQDYRGRTPSEFGSSSQDARPNVPCKSLKSHARKREDGHIPRPRNAFIIFRTDFVKNGRIPASIEAHSQNLSRIAGSVWKGMTPEEKRPWFARADEEKARHAERHPEYQYHPTDPYSLRNRRRVKKGRGEDETGAASRRCAEVASLLKEGASVEALERAITELDKRTPMVVDEFPAVNPCLDGSISSERSTISNPLDQEPIDVPGIASLLSLPPPLSRSSRESTPATLSSSSSSSSSPSTDVHTLALPSMPPALFSVIPSKVSRFGVAPTFPGALHVPDKPLFGTSAFQNVLPSKVRSYGAPSAFQIPPTFPSSSMLPRQSEGGNGESWALRGPLQPSFATRGMRGSDSEENSDYESD